MKNNIPTHYIQLVILIQRKSEQISHFCNTVPQKNPFSFSIIYCRNSWKPWYQRVSSDTEFFQVYHKSIKVA